MLAKIKLMSISGMEETMSTKEKIMDAALTLFAENGYDGTSVEQRKIDQDRIIISRKL